MGRNYSKSKEDEKRLFALSERLMKTFAPHGNRTSLAWTLCAPFLVAAYRKTEYYKDAVPEIEKHISETGLTRRELERDICYCDYAFGVCADEYFNQEMYLLSNLGRSRIYVDTALSIFNSKMNDFDKSELFDNKLLSAEIFGKWYRRDYAPLTREADVPGCVELIKKHGACIVKPLNGSGGHGVHIVKLSDTEDPAEFFAKDLKENGAFIVEELIKQHPFMSAIYPNSINTVRVHTVLSKKGKVKIFCPYLRMGVGGSFVDNFSVGGITAIIEAETGFIFGRLHPCDYSNFIYHPDTGTRVIGLTIPYWDDLKAMAEELAHVRPDFRFVGWDFALAEDGKWTIIEPNRNPGPTNYQDANHHGMKHAYLDIMKWSDEN